MSHQDFLNDMYAKYRENREKWVESPEVVGSAMKKYYNSPEKHYELLRLIVYKLDEGKYDVDYLNFLTTLLFTVLEENAMSLIYRDRQNAYFNPGLKKILKKYPEFFIDGYGLSFSNTQVIFLIKKLQRSSYGGRKSKERKSRKRKSKERKSRKRKSKERKSKERN